MISALLVHLIKIASLQPERICCFIVAIRCSYRQFEQQRWFGQRPSFRDTPVTATPATSLQRYYPATRSGADRVS